MLARRLWRGNMRQGGAATARTEPRNDSVERAVGESKVAASLASAQLQEVGRCLWNHIGAQLEDNAARGLATNVDVKEDLRDRIVGQCSAQSVREIP